MSLLAPQQPALRLTGHHNLTTRLLLSTLIGVPVRISQIRSSSAASPGLLPHEVSLLRLFESVTNGTQISFSHTGTTLLYRPGLITGSVDGYGASGGVTRHSPPEHCARGASYFLLPMAILAPFSKHPFNILLTGPGVLTSSTATGDISLDALRTHLLPLLAHFGVTLNTELRILRRASPGPDGRASRALGPGGEAQLLLGHQLRLPKTLHLLRPGRVKQIRGVAYATGVPAANCARMIDAARALLNPLCADVYVFSDAGPAPRFPRDAGGGAPASAPAGDKPGAQRRPGIGFGMCLTATTTSASSYLAETHAAGQGGEAPEAVGARCAHALLESIGRGGCADGVAAPWALLLMSVGAKDVGRLRLGREVVGDGRVVALARDVRAFGGATWGLRDAGEGDGEDGGGGGDVVVSVVGSGVGNVGRKIA